MPTTSPARVQQPGMTNPLSSSSSPSLPDTAAVAPAPAPAPTSSGTPRSSTSTAAAPPAATTPPAASGAASTRDDTNGNGNSNDRPATSAPSNAPSSSSKSHRRSSTSGVSSLRSSFLSRLSLPLPNRAKNRHILEFHISPHEPHKRYSPGDHVRGSVKVVLVKPLRITHLTVALSGYVRVFKDPTVRAQGSTQDVTALLPQGGSKRPQYHGNGFASLFQDEQVLSGDGRLDAGKYEFGFDLVFPSKGLPSSIDFERGTISYIISATLTRPTSIAPTTTTDRKIMLSNQVDIGLVNAPSPKTVFLEPVSKRKGRKKSFGFDKATQPTPEINDLASEAGSADPSVITDDSGRERTVEQRTIDQSDIRSEISGESGHSVSTGGLSRAQLSQIASARQQVVDDKTITATVSLTKGGCLPGDTVSVRVNVQHIKRLKSMNGVIVTLFRQGKIDSSPDPSLFTNMMTREERRQREKGEAYPRSRTGLGGLSLSSTSSTSVFRKDLDQSTAPLIVDPVTLQASVTVSVKIPDNTFPTIRRVPGDMIRFVYQIEVIVDLGGRLSNQFKGGQDSKANQAMAGSYDGGGNNYSPRRQQTITDTAPLRREKGVIAVSMEAVVGTTDSNRGRTRQRVSPSSRTIRTTFSDDEEQHFTEYGPPDDMHYGTPYVNGNSSNGYFSSQHGSHPYDRPPALPHPLTPGGPSQPYPYAATNGDAGEAPAYIPRPQLPDQHQLSEKERIRQAETRLLPSQPPAGPSAPAEEENVYDADDTPRLPHANPSSPQVPTEDGPSAPTQDDLSRPDDPRGGEDKQEVERQRLMGEASAPPEVPEDMDRRRAGPSAPGMGPEAEPSAPVLEEEDEFGGYGASSSSRRDHNEQLPAYER